MLRSTFQSFETAKRALVASQMGLDTVGHNISNANTLGYTRQRVDQVSISSGGYSSKYQIRNGMNQIVGQGSLVTGVNQIRDTTLDTRYRNEACNYGNQAIKSSGLTDLEGIIDSVTKDNLGEKLGDLITELTKFAQDTTSAELATVVQNVAIQLCSMINKTHSELTELLKTTKEDLQTDVSTNVNLVLEQIAYLNEKIRQDHFYGNPSNELMDARNLLIDQLSEFLPIKVVNTPEKVSDDLTISNLSIVLVDNSVVPAVEYTLVDGNSYNELNVKEDSDGFVQISLLQGNKELDITNHLSSGAVRGYVDLINGIGDYAGNSQNNYRGIQYYMKSLDTFAETFARTMNQMNAITAADAAGKSTVFEFDPRDLFGTSDDSGIITAANIVITNEWKNDVWWLTTTKEEYVEPIPKKDENGNDLFDEKGNPVYEVPANSDNILKFMNQLKGNNYFQITNGDGKTISKFNGSFQEYWTSIQTDLGLDKNLTSTLLAASATVISGYADMRDSVSAVSVDEEAINMMTYQNYYNAAARYMTVIDEALGTVIQGMGVVGR